MKGIKVKDSTSC